MRREWLEGGIVGVMIGLLVVLIRALLVDAPEFQILAFAVAAVAVCAVQVALLIRRVRRSSNARSAGRIALLRRSNAPRNPFDREANHSWTGLVERPPPDASQPDSTIIKPTPDEEMP